MRILLAALLLALLAAPAQAARPFDTGFFDDFSQPERLEDAVRTGSSVVRVNASWSGVAPTRPTVPRDPNDPAYQWAHLDAVVSSVQARGLQVLLSIDRAPTWAEGGGRRTQGILAGSWKPNARAAGDFVEAAARRYPNIRYIQLWNEPNLDFYLAPQWRKGRAFAPVRYRQMLDSAYAGLKRARTGAKLVTAGTAPYGDPERGGHRIMPARFWRVVLKRKVRFDILSHHPYAIAGPRRRALNRDDVAIPDIRKLTRLVRGAVRSGKLLPRKRKRFWVTEISWDSRAPDPHGVPLARHARWLADAFFVLWKQGVDTVTWFQTRDAPPPYASSNQSGVFFRDGRAKPAARAFAFPFSCERRGSRRTRVWGKAPTGGTVRIRHDGRTVRRLRAGSNRVFTGTVGGRGRFSARSGGVTSIGCRT